MHRIKNLEEVILRGDGLFVEVIEKETKANLILPESVSHQDVASYIKVVAVGNKVEDIKPGYIILDVGSNFETFLVKGKRYGMLFRGSVLVAIPSDNFDESAKDNKANALSS